MLEFNYDGVYRGWNLLVTQVSTIFVISVPSALLLVAALQHLKPGKVPGPDSICPEPILHAGAALKSWLRDFLSPCLRPLSGIAQKTILVRHTAEATRGLGMGAGAKTLRIATLSLVYSTAEYCAPIWCRSAHTRLIDSVLNDALRIVTGCLRPTPTDHLPVLSGIQPAELRRMGTTLSLAHLGSLSYLVWSFLVGPQILAK